jgi:hypothetical protein
MVLAEILAESWKPESNIPGSRKGPSANIPNRPRSTEAQNIFELQACPLRL